MTENNIRESIKQHTLEKSGGKKFKKIWWLTFRSQILSQHWTVAAWNFFYKGYKVEKTKQSRKLQLKAKIFLAKNGYYETEMKSSMRKYFVIRVVIQNKRNKYNI